MIHLLLILVIASHLCIGPNQRRLQRPFFKPAMKRFSGSAERPAHHSSNVQSTMAIHSVSYSAQQLEVLQCLDKEGWLVTPLLNGCRIAVLSRACKQALEGWPSRLQCLEFLQIYGDLEVARKLQWVAQHCPQLRYLVLNLSLIHI